MEKHIYLASPHMSDAGYEMEYIKEAFDTNWIAPLGKNVDEFEKELSAKVKTSDGAALVSGTSAIHLALKALGIGKGDRVFCQSLTFSASVNPVIYEGAVPVFIDSDEKTWNISPVALEKAFQKYEKMGNLPKAVIIVHLYGMAVDLDPVLEICKKYQVPIIEDAAESLGTTYKGQYTGTFGEYGIFSFNGNKIITTSGGGMLVCNLEDKEAAKERVQKARFWATQARDAARHYQHTEIGYNYRMSNVVAGIGRGQLKVLDERIGQKKHIFEYYKKNLSNLKGISFMPIHEWEDCNCWLTGILLADDCNVTPVELMKALEIGDIESRPIWKPMHLQPIFCQYDFISEEEREFHIVDEEIGADDSVSGEIFRRGVCLPSDSKMTDEDLTRVCKIIQSLDFKN